MPAAKKVAKPTKKVAKTAAKPAKKVAKKQAPAKKAPVASKTKNVLDDSCDKVVLACIRKNKRGLLRCEITERTGLDNTPQLTASFRRLAQANLIYSMGSTKAARWYPIAVDAG